MAFVTPPNSSDDIAESPGVKVLEEGSDEKQENLELQGVVEIVEQAYRRSKDRRITDEQRWLEAYRNYRGIYGPEVAFTSTEKSQAFIKVTKTKVLAAYAQLVDVLLAGSKFPIGIEARKYPNNVAGEVNYDPNMPDSEEIEAKTGVKYEPKRVKLRPEIERELGVFKNDLAPIEENLEVGAGNSPTAITFEPAKEAARMMEKKMHDQLEESHASKHLRTMAFEACLFGTGIIKGPFAYDQEYPRWTENGEYDPEFKTIPKIEAVSIWDFYPDPDARNMSEAEWAVQRHRMSRTQVRQLRNRPYFRADSIALALDYGESYIPHYWEATLEDDKPRDQLNRYEVLEYWGIVDAEVAEEAGIDIPEELGDRAELQVNIWICNGQILRLVLNPFTPTRIPFMATPFEVNPYSMFGVGVAENMQDTQLLMNGYMRMAIDNAALSGNLLIEVDETNLVPGQDLDIYPGKIFRRQSGAPGQAIFSTSFKNVSNELIMMFDKARQLADEATGIPSYSHGQSGVTGVGRTAAGMSMLMGAAAQNTKAVVRNVDDYLLTPLGKALFAFNMQFNFDEEFTKGDLEVIARGTESLMRNEVRSQKLLQFMQMSQNPAMAPFVKYDYILRELATSMDLDEEKILNDPREAAIQAKMMSEIQALMPQPPQGQGQPQGGPPPVSDPTGNGGANIGPGAAPEPDAAGYTGAGGGDNGGNAPAAPQGAVQ